MGEISTGSISMMGCFFGCFRFNPFQLKDDTVVVVCRNPPPFSDGLRLVPQEQTMSRNQDRNDCNSSEDDIDKAGILPETPEATSEKDYSSSIKFPTRRCAEAYVKNNIVAQACDNIFTPRKIYYENQQPFPTPLRLTEEMQTPATVYPSSQDTVKNGSRIRSQYVYPVVEDDGDVGNSEKEYDHGRNPGDDDDGDIGNNNMLNGIPNSTTKYKEDHKVGWHATPFVERLEKELVRNHKPSTAIQFLKEGEKSNLAEPTALRLKEEMQTPATVYPSSQNTVKNGSRIRSQYVYPVVEDDGDVGNSEKEYDHGRNPGDDDDDIGNNNMLNGIPNSTTKYKEDHKVGWHATPFVERLEKELVRNHKPSTAIQFLKEGEKSNLAEPTALRLKEEMQTPATVYPSSQNTVKNGSRIRSQYVYPVVEDDGDVGNSEKEYDHGRNPGDDDDDIGNNNMLNGIPNSTTKYKDHKVGWHTTPFVERLEKELVRNHKPSASIQFLKEGEKSNFAEPTALRLKEEMQTPATVYPSSQNTVKNGSRIRSQYVYPVVEEDDDDVGKSEKEYDHWRNSGDDDGDDIGNNDMLNGIPNSTTKYNENQKVCWHATPFVERLEKKLVRNHKPSTAIQFWKEVRNPTLQKQQQYL
ncbi:hypothetical protein ZOSMA_38G01350 [Zostera marina]|uniref:Uncharacterized protein n=1 Tax=Zostera marina TaxID=29655 RepID=A0A0K9P4U1_ZOSMR|nr:hypothetical protein ZOSMA_38G01350 [Zostera marina]